jgi:hypothetical protein
MYIDTKHCGVWHISKGPSPFVFRKGKQDVSVASRAGWGIKRDDGFHYDTQVRFAAESGAVISEYSRMPPEITPDLLKQWGFLD